MALGITLALDAVIGVVLGLLGGGGSILAVPALVYVLGLGIEHAIPMSLIVVGIASAVGVPQLRCDGVGCVCRATDVKPGTCALRRCRYALV